MLDRFEVMAELGRGGMGRVLLARDRKLDRLVALKLLLDEEARPEDWARFAEEARILARLRHEHIVSLLDFSHDGESPFIVFEYVEGPSLAEELAKGGALPLETFRTAGLAICQAMDWAHGQGILHRDLKAENVFLSKQGPKIGDFGLALRSDRSRALTRTGLLMGTPAYMAPELIQGERASPASDLYAAGVLFHFMATGRLPFAEKSIPELLRAHAHERPPSPLGHRPELPPDLASTILRCLEKDSGRRPRSFAELAVELTGRTPVPAPTRALPRITQGGQATRFMAAPRAGEGEGKAWAGPRGIAWSVLAILSVLAVVLVGSYRPGRARPPVTMERLDVHPTGARFLLRLPEASSLTWQLQVQDRILSQGRSPASTSRHPLEFKALSPRRSYRLQFEEGGRKGSLSFATPSPALTGDVHVTALRRAMLVELRSNLRSPLTLEIRDEGNRKLVTRSLPPRGKSLIEGLPYDRLKHGLAWRLLAAEEVLAQGRSPIRPRSVASPVISVTSERRIRSACPRHSRIDWYGERFAYCDVTGWIQCWERKPANDPQGEEAPLRLAWLYRVGACPSSGEPREGTHGDALPWDENSLFYGGNVGTRRLAVGRLVVDARARARPGFWTHGSERLVVGQSAEWRAPLPGEWRKEFPLDQAARVAQISRPRNGRAWIFLSEKENLRCLELELPALQVLRNVLLTREDFLGQPFHRREAAGQLAWGRLTRLNPVAVWIVPIAPVLFQDSLWLLVSPFSEEGFQRCLMSLLEIPLAHSDGERARFHGVWWADVDGVNLMVDPEGKRLLTNGLEAIYAHEPGEAHPRTLLAQENRLSGATHVIGIPFHLDGRRHVWTGHSRKMPEILGDRYDVAFGGMVQTLPERGLTAMGPRSAGLVFDTEVGAHPIMRRFLFRGRDRVFSATSRNVCVVDGPARRAAAFQSHASGRVRGLGVSAAGLIAVVGSDGDALVLPGELLLSQGIDLAPLPVGEREGPPSRSR